MSLNAFSLKFKRGTAAEWLAYDGILAESEKGYETDSRRWKTGDGTLPWSQLAYDDDLVAQTGSYVRFENGNLVAPDNSTIPTGDPGVTDYDYQGNPTGSAGFQDASY